MKKQLGPLSHQKKLVQPRDRLITILKTYRRRLSESQTFHMSTHGCTENNSLIPKQNCKTRTYIVEALPQYKNQHLLSSILCIVCIATREGHMWYQNVKCIHDDIKINHLNWNILHKVLIVIAYDKLLTYIYEMHN